MIVRTDGFPVVIAQRLEYCQFKQGTLVSPIFILYYEMCNCFKWRLAIGGRNQLNFITIIPRLKPLNLSALHLSVA